MVPTTLTGLIQLSRRIFLDLLHLTSQPTSKLAITLAGRDRRRIVDSGASSAKSRESDASTGTTDSIGESTTKLPLYQFHPSTLGFSGHRGSQRNPPPGTNWRYQTEDSQGSGLLRVGVPDLINCSSSTLRISGSSHRLLRLDDHDTNDSMIGVWAGHHSATNNEVQIGIRRSRGFGVT
ncbi:hypothetical protein P175DRAFT_0558189 [Aspergillus ochraceoroseus IBT 24754]|uniref:Uncharacterized protein n=1 Tax=Aspergillus ochraceoroseus IBT 24754 TaxID=1392256 RepID=A0A2T5LUN0_9EURO|nr:uncharacterized protein P175DRAFT_0558189 [Aspergillus ochraceoroseus IBT 24754]PTU19996.1 hypothetical protein P175DRAFT_0558189 [Aspergillus ochraceoroseus IBT 24754]